MEFFKVLKKHKHSKARLGLIKTAHGNIHTPAFLPVATKAAIKSLSPEEIKKIGFEAILSNTYHLYLQPGSKIIKKLGDLHKFMNWPGPIITDSGGFQVFSLGFGLKDKVGKILNKNIQEEQVGQQAKLARIDQAGVTFTSHLDGSHHRFTPESSIKIQEDLGADIIFVFDECTSPLANYDYTQKSMERTHQWAQRCLKAKKRNKQALFGIVQGGLFKDLRQASAKFIGDLPFDGFGIGGSFGKGEMKKALDWVIPYLPSNKPRHLLGIGYLDDIKEAVKRGIDLFDCVQPTRLARHGTFLTAQGKFSILKSVYQTDKKPISKNCSCDTCQNFNRAYLHHLFKTKEILGARLATFHNLWFISRFMEKIRRDIKEDKNIG
ncbi:MAG: tRNA guanosine(34) transglycosylase Tgt [Parcubacteria group bacterium]|jgi:queuine tRNA-ribosyltransferase|nr:tRNA guanosine(34) transglycosylase Tgt [Parcubacteria group bacterium]